MVTVGLTARHRGPTTVGRGDARRWRRASCSPARSTGTCGRWRSRPPRCGAWARRQPVTAGIFLGLAVAAKLYPLFLLGPLLILCLRAGRMSDWLRLAATTAVAWLAVNLPFMLTAPDAWATFYRFSQERGIGFGSPWYALERHGLGVPTDLLNLAGSAAFLALCVGIAALIWCAPRRPRVAQVAFLVVAAFLLTNKVYSPQYVVWLVPLFVLARPRWRDFLIWQSAEVLYFFAVWWHIEGLQNPDLRIPDWPHSWATVLRMAAQALHLRVDRARRARPDTRPGARGRRGRSRRGRARRCARRSQVHVDHDGWSGRTGPCPCGRPGRRTRRLTAPATDGLRRKTRSIRMPRFLWNMPAR